MSELTTSQLTRAVLAQARALGASIAGATTMDRVLAGPSYLTEPLMPAWEKEGAGNRGTAPRRELGFQPRGVVVVGLAHPGGRPELDWWQADIPSRTLGNVKLAEISKGLARWLTSEHGVAASDLMYFVQSGGVYLKDAAVAAGLGVVGKNNLFLCPELGPRVRLRALALEAELEPGGPLDWDPCPVCPAPCREACPQGALDLNAASWPDNAPALLPGRDGAYRRQACLVQMDADLEAGQEIIPPGKESPALRVRYCRRCELACPAGRGA